MDSLPFRAPVEADREKRYTLQECLDDADARNRVIFSDESGPYSHPDWKPERGRRSAKNQTRRRRWNLLRFLPKMLLMVVPVLGGAFLQATFPKQFWPSAWNDILAVWDTATGWTQWLAHLFQGFF